MPVLAVRRVECGGYRLQQRAADVQAIRTILAVSPPLKTTAGSDIWGGEELLKKSVTLWQKKFGHAGKVISFPSTYP